MLSQKVSVGPAQKGKQVLLQRLLDLILPYIPPREYPCNIISVPRLTVRNPMEQIQRCAFGLADPKEHINQHPAILAGEGYQRQMRTPLERFVIRCQIFYESLPNKLTVIPKWVWRVTLGRWLYIKRAALGRTEMAATRFVASHTSIPVPRMWMCFRWRGYDYLVMSRIKGVQLVENWSQLSEDTRTVIAEQIRGCFRLHEDGTTGPFRDEDHMNLQLRWLRPLEECPTIVQTAHTRKHPLVFTHNDLAPRNIMIDPTSGKVMAVVDWESAGWFPAHWEYCKTMNWIAYAQYHAEFKRWIPRMIPVYEEEAEADRVLMYEMGELNLNPYCHAP